MVRQPAADAPASCCIVIPARYESSRFPGKPLARLRGANGVERSLIEWSWRAARAVPGDHRIIVATDDQRIVDEVEKFGGSAMMTPSDCFNGTERCAAVLNGLDEQPEIILNFQGDAPLTPPDIAAAVIRRIRGDASLSVATPAIRCNESTAGHLLADSGAGRVGGTTMVFDHAHNALYFSKSLIPHIPAGSAPGSTPLFLHLGIYAYRPDALASYAAMKPAPLELAEGLEQLRFLEAGVRVAAVICDPPEGSTVELNNPSDVPLIEAELQRRGLSWE